MKIAIEYADTHVTVEMPGTDYDSGEVIEMFTRMMVVVGYPPSVIDLAEDSGTYRYVEEDEEIVKRKELDADSSM